MNRWVRGLHAIGEFPGQVLTVYQDTRKVPALKKPEVVQFPVNDVCNSRCQMCFIWQQKKSKELTPDEVSSILSDELFDQVRGIGINGGEPTLRSDLAELVEAAALTLPALKHVSIITNAIQRDRVLDRIREISGVTREYGIDFDVMVSLDGVGEVHDQVRGKPGNFKNAVHVLKAVREERLAETLRIGCTLTETNAGSGEELLEWAIEHDIYARFRVAVAHNRLYNRECVDDYEVKASQLFPILMLLDRLSRDYEPDEQRRRFYRSLLEQLAYGAPRNAGCMWRNRGVTLLANGHLGYCAVESPELGNALSERPSNIYWANDHVRKQILTNKCAGCRHDYDGPWDFSEEVKARSRQLPILGTLSRHMEPAYRSSAESLATAGELASGVATRRASLPRSGRRGETVVLTGWYGTETVGDQAILGGILSVLNDMHDGPVVVSSLEPFVTERTLRLLEAPNNVSVMSYHGVNALIDAGEARFVAMAGGPLMGTIPQIRTLGRTHRNANRVGVPTGLLGIGVGPLGGRLATALISRIIKESDVVVTRDDPSADHAADIGAASVTSAGDPSLIWLDRGGNRRNESAELDDGDLVLAIRRWPIHEYGAGKFTSETRSRFESVLSQEIKSISARRRLVPVAMGTVHVGGDDRRILRELLGPLHSPLTALTEFPTPQGVQTTMLACRYSLAMRYHAALFSAALGLATVTIDYTGGGKLYALTTQFPDVIRIDPEEMSYGHIEDALNRVNAVPAEQVDRLRLKTVESIRSGLAELVA